MQPFDLAPRLGCGDRLKYLVVIPGPNCYAHSLKIGQMCLEDLADEVARIGAGDDHGIRRKPQSADA